MRRVHCKGIFAFVILMLAIFNSVASDTKTATILGNLSVITQGNTCYALLGNIKIKLPFDCEYSYPPHIIGKFTKNTQPYNEIVVLQESPQGQACNERGPIYLFGLKNDGSTDFFDSIPMCDRTPELDVVNNQIVFPARDLDTTNMLPYQKLKAAYLPKETYCYTEGKIKTLDSPIDKKHKPHLSGGGNNSVAFLPFEAPDSALGSYLTDYAQNSFVQYYKGYSVVERGKIASIFHENKFQLTSISGDAAQAGHILGVRGVVIGKLTELGTLTTMSIQVVNVETGQIMNSNQTSAKNIAKEDIPKILVDPTIQKLIASSDKQAEATSSQNLITPSVKTAEAVSGNALNLTIKGWSNVVTDRLFFTPKLFVKVYYGDSLVGKTKTVSGTTADIGETFTIDDYEGATITLQFFDQHATQDKFVARAYLYSPDNAPKGPESDLEKIVNGIADIAKALSENGPHTYSKPKSNEYQIIAKSEGKYYSYGLIDVSIK